MAKNNGEVTGWVGWIGFASLMLYLAGFMHIITGLAALLNDNVYLATPSALWVLDITQWGWAHVLVGLIAILAANSLLQGHGFGRTVAVLVAMTSAIANMAFIPTYPIWATVIIAVDILVIYGVVVHGGELKD